MFVKATAGSSFFIVKGTAAFQRCIRRWIGAVGAKVTSGKIESDKSKKYEILKKQLQVIDTAMRMCSKWNAGFKGQGQEFANAYARLISFHQAEPASDLQIPSLVRETYVESLIEIRSWSLLSVELSEDGLLYLEDDTAVIKTRRLAIEAALAEVCVGLFLMLKRLRKQEHTLRFGLQRS